MKTSEFIEKFKESLDIDESAEMTIDTDLRSFPEYDSMSVLSIIALIDECFGKKIKGEAFITITTLRSLMTLIGMENFEE